MTAAPAGPYAPEIPLATRPAEGWRSPFDHLTDALGNLPGTAELAAELVNRLGIARTRVLAKAIDAASHKAIEDAAEDRAAGQLAAAFEQQRQHLADQAPAAEPIYRCPEDGCTWDSGALEPFDATGAYADHQAVHDEDDADEDEPAVSPV